jgi:hypothetical protein
VEREADSEEREDLGLELPGQEKRARGQGEGHGHREGDSASREAPRREEDERHTGRVRERLENEEGIRGS